MLEQLLSNNNKELSYKSGSILENINTTSEEAMISDIDELGASYGKNVISFLNTVRNEIIPAMEKTETMLLDSIQNKKFEVKNAYNIVKLDLPALFTNLNNNGGLNMVGNGSIPMTSITLPTPKKEDIRNWFITDSEDINYDTASILESVTDEELIDIWEKYLYSFSTDNILIKDLNLFSYSKLDVVVLLFTALRNLTVKDPVEVSNLMVFKKSIVDMFDYIKNVIKRYIALYNASAETKLVHNIKIDRDITNIYMFDAAYDKFINESVYGVDSIIGYGIVSMKNDSNTFALYLNDMLEKESIYYKASMNHIDMVKLKHNKDKIEGYILTYRVHGSRIYKDIISELSSTVSEETFNIIYKEVIKQTEDENQELDVELFVRNVFSGIYPRVKKFLAITVQMESTGIDSDLTLTPNEIILYSTLELITSELMDQVYVKEVPTYKV